jgi:hypothetical protein
VGEKKLSSTVVQPREFAMPPLAVFGIGQTELIIVAACVCGLGLPLLIVGVVLAVLAANRSRDDRRK